MIELALLINTYKNVSSYRELSEGEWSIIAGIEAKFL